MKIVIVGASGRMGRMLIEATLNTPDAQLYGAVDVSNSSAIGRDAGELIGLSTGVKVQSDLVAALVGADVLIDFTRPEGTLSHLALCVTHGVNIVIGTTGFDAAGKLAIEQAAQTIGVVFAPNMSVGVNATFKLLQVAAQLLNEGYDIEVIEAHHRHKVDAPSGTALKMGEIIAQATGRDLATDAVYARQGYTGERSSREIGFATIRGGDIVGDHTVLFAGMGERIEITHKSSSRMTYATGSLRAASFLVSQRRKGVVAGLYDMQAVLNIHDGVA
jgi:4-hydroxy-tetrahydrodipicolinate reductase